MKMKLPKNPSLLGFKTPKGFSETSKKSILSMVYKKEKKKSIYQLLSWTGVSAAAIITLFFALQQPMPLSSTEDQATFDDPFVTSLLIDTLLLDEKELDLQIQKALLEDIENDLALK